ncbi:hypothetical protein EVAR_56187_1 [Eumeta japonica]|uniref:Uncharacterized protein n=1 Tax=Eumeta variegata TaxID=151549 RepID=A0A4C1ZQW8_EUMVA|nr:hypothetical protein EVAR_56187_1 [Eumeta japonica]
MSPHKSQRARPSEAAVAAVRTPDPRPISFFFGEPTFSFLFVVCVFFRKHIIDSGGDELRGDGVYAVGLETCCRCCGWSHFEGVTLGNVTMSHRRRRGLLRLSHSTMMIGLPRTRDVFVEGKSDISKEEVKRRRIFSSPPAGLRRPRTRRWTASS